MGTVASLKQSEYTGKNRCAPCTVVNGAIAVVLTIAAWFAISPGISIVIFLAAVTVIYFNGYLIPGTPKLTKHYLPTSVLQLFGKEPVAGSSHSVPDPDAPLPVWLRDVGVITDPSEPKLTDSFAATWETAIRKTDVEMIDEHDIRVLFGTDDVSRHAETSIVINSNQMVRWISKAALTADVAAGNVFAARTATWTELSSTDRVTLLRRLRLFLRYCPSCGGTVEMNQRTVEPCCERPHTLMTVRCENCGTPLGEAAVAGVNEEVSGRTRIIRDRTDVS